MSAQWDFIERAAHSLGIAAEALRKWRVRGVPGRYRLPITRLAESKGRRIEAETFDQPPGPRRQPRLAGRTNRPKSPPTPSNRKHGGSTVTPEDSIRASEPRPFTGAEYIVSLHDGREVYIDGERVADVTAHPAFRNSVRSLARLYDALHDPKTREVLTAPTDTGSGGYTHKYFRVARSRDELVAQQRAIAEWSRLSYGWMGRTPDYKASLMNTLGANAEYYGQFAANARRWYRAPRKTCCS
jgi:4-hydroxyphenylacetate 3-hydroxylase N terminal